MNTTINSYDYYSHISNKDQFHELILTQEGNLYIDSALENAADSFYMHYNGNIYCIQGENRYISGSLPEGHLAFPSVVGKTTFHNVEDGGCLLHGNEPILEDDMTACVVFRHKDKLGLYMADSTVSRCVYLMLMEYTPEDDVLYTEVFIRLLAKHDTAKAENLTRWLNLYGNSSKEV